jgi:hypothetical protein
LLTHEQLPPLNMKLLVESQTVQIADEEQFWQPIIFG